MKIIILSDNVFSGDAAKQVKDVIQLIEPESIVIRAHIEKTIEIYEG